jgi:hypothetical protein
MNDKTGGNRGPRRAGALAAAAAVAVLAAACGGGSAPSSASAPTYTQELALAQCMRGHGEPGFPDPDTSGGYTLTPNGSIEGAGGSSIDIDSSQAQAAYGDCRHLLPGAPSLSQLEQDTQQEQQRQAQELPLLLKYSQCMRSHGVPGFPDLGGSGQSPAPGKSAINPDSPQFQAAAAACQHLLPPGAHVSVHSNSSAS